MAVKGTNAWWFRGPDHCLIYHDVVCARAESVEAQGCFPFIDTGLDELRELSPHANHTIQSVSHKVPELSKLCGDRPPPFIQNVSNHF